MKEPKQYELEVGGKTLTIQHGILANQANGSVTVRLGDTTTAPADWFRLTVLSRTAALAVRNRPPPPKPVWFAVPPKSIDFAVPSNATPTAVQLQKLPVGSPPQLSKPWAARSSVPSTLPVLFRPS